MTILRLRVTLTSPALKTVDVLSHCRHVLHGVCAFLVETALCQADRKRCPLDTLATQGQTNIQRPAYTLKPDSFAVVKATDDTADMILTLDTQEQEWTLQDGTSPQTPATPLGLGWPWASSKMTITSPDVLPKRTDLTTMAFTFGLFTAHAREQETPHTQTLILADAVLAAILLKRDENNIATTEELNIVFGYQEGNSLTSSAETVLVANGLVQQETPHPGSRLVIRQTGELAQTLTQHPAFAAGLDLGVVLPVSLFENIHGYEEHKTLRQEIEHLAQLPAVEHVETAPPPHGHRIITLKRMLTTNGEPVLDRIARVVKTHSGSPLTTSVRENENA